MANIAIISAPERLFGAYSKDPATAYFGMNISAAIVGKPADVTDENMSYLFPWNWNVTGVRVFVADKADPTSGKEFTAELVPKPAIDNQPAIEKLLQKALPTAPEGFLFPETQQDGGTFGSDHNWNAVLAHASTYPSPVPQAMNLVFHFSRKGASGSGAIVRGADSGCQRESGRQSEEISGGFGRRRGDDHRQQRQPAGNGKVDLRRRERSRNCRLYPGGPPRRAAKEKYFHGLQHAVDQASVSHC